MKVYYSLLLGLAALVGCGEGETALTAQTGLEPEGQGNTEQVSEVKGSEKASPETELPDGEDAKVILASALEAAKVQDKRVFVHLGAPW